MKSILLFCVFSGIITTTKVFGDGLACVNTFDNQFVIFDRGKIIYQDHNPAQQFWIGHNYIAFLDYMNSLRIWNNGHAREIWKGSGNVYSYDSMLVWEVAGTLRCWKNGQIFYIANRADFFRVNEGTVVFYDNILHQLFVWHDGTTSILDENQIDFPFLSISISKNTVAWLTPTFEFKVYFGGKTRSMTFYEPNLLYTTGENFCLLNNPQNNFLELITPDTEIMLEPQPAKWWKTSYRNFCYLNQRNDFISHDPGGNPTILNTQMPSFVLFTTKGLFFEKNRQISFYKEGVQYRVVDYIPNVFHAYSEIFFFRNNSNLIEVWNGRLPITTTIPPEAKVEFLADVILFYQANRPSFWYNNRIYEIR